MGLLTAVSATPAVIAANQVLAIVAQQFRQLARSGGQGYNLIWANPDATPQQVIAALGSNAVAVFQLAGLNLSTIASAAAIGGTSPPAIPEVPAGWTLTPDGVNAGALDVTVPPATVPVGLAAVNASAGSTVAWTAVPGALSYTLQKSVNGAAFAALATNTTRLTGGGQVPVTPPAATYADAAGASGDRYQVCVTTPAGTSDYSTPVTL